MIAIGKILWNEAFSLCGAMVGQRSTIDRLSVELAIEDITSVLLSNSCCSPLSEGAIDSLRDGCGVNGNASCAELDLNASIIRLSFFFLGSGSL